MTEHYDSDVENLLLTKVQVSRALGVDEGTVDNWRSKGLGPPYIKLGDFRTSPVRYPRKDLIDWIKTRPRIVPSVEQNVEEAHDRS